MAARSAPRRAPGVSSASLGDVGRARGVGELQGGGHRCDAGLCHYELRPRHRGAARALPQGLAERALGRDAFWERACGKRALLSVRAARCRNGLPREAAAAPSIPGGVRGRLGGGLGGPVRYEMGRSAAPSVAGRRRFPILEVPPKPGRSAVVRASRRRVPTDGAFAWARARPVLIARSAPPSRPRTEPPTASGRPPATPPAFA